MGLRGVRTTGGDRPDGQQSGKADPARAARSAVVADRGGLAHPALPVLEPEPVVHGLDLLSFDGEYFENKIYENERFVN
jgi:hypothetical protein